MERKKIIDQESLHPFICYKTIEEAHILLEDYIKADLSDDEIFIKHDIAELNGEEPLIYLIPDFEYEGDYCPKCQRPVSHRVNEEREIIRLFCPSCEEPPLNDKMKAIQEFFIQNKFPFFDK